MGALRRNVLCEFRQEVQRREDLEIPFHSRFRSVSLRVGKGAAGLLLGLIDDLSCIADLDQPRETERTTSHVLDQTLDTSLIARWQEHRLVHAETTVLPTAHALDDFRFDLVLGQIQREDRLLPSDQQSLHIKLGQLQKIALGCKRAASDQHVDVRMPVKEFAMSLDRRDHPGHHILAPKQANRFRLEARPRTGRELAQQLAVEPSV